MPQKVLKFSGINRKINEFQASGACEELINLRPGANGGHSVVRQKKVVKSNVEYSAVYEHSFGSTSNLIAVTDTGIVMWINPEGSPPMTILSEFRGKDVKLTIAGNVIVAYCPQDMKQQALRFVNGTYEKYNVTIAEVEDIQFNHGNIIEKKVTADEESAGALNAALQTNASAFYGEFPNGLCGSAIVGCTYELEDGSEFGSTAFIVVTTQRNDMLPKISSKDITFKGYSSASIRIKFGEAYHSGIKKVNIYSTRPVLPYEITEDENGKTIVKSLTLEDVNLAGQLMHYQGSVTPTAGYVDFTLNFGTSLAGESVLDVNSGCIERVGSSVSYNSRFHYFDSDVFHLVQLPSVSKPSSEPDAYATWAAFVKVGKEWVALKKKYQFDPSVPHDYIYPLGGIEQIAFVELDSSSNIRFDGDMFFVDMKESSAYNYSYAFDKTSTLVDARDFYENELKDLGYSFNSNLVTMKFNKRALLKKEANAVNVSAQYNPFVFPVKYSYSFGGKVLDIATAYTPISSTQIGQYPLSVFTSNGIFALEQGDGSTLYSNITPLQPLVIDGKALSTPSGTFFISSRSLYILLGREVADVSAAIKGKLEMSLRNTDAYKRLCCSRRSIFHNFSSQLSEEDFEDYASGAELSYDQLNNEVSVSKAGSSYSYVFNIDTKTFHKAGRRFICSQSGSRYAIEESDGAMNVVDMHTEEHDYQPVLMQSRPMPLDTFSTHIQRLILLADATLEGEQNLCVSVFGSDNLSDWKCIISAQKCRTALRQIRTNRAAKSYRDYVFLITGTVGTDTDISELIADYTLVSRRMG